MRPRQPPRAPPTGPTATRSRPRAPSIRESALSPAGRYGHPRPTSIRKSPVLSPACQATPPSSTDSRYCRAGKAGVGVNSSMGVSAGKARTESALQPGGRVQGGSLTPTGPWRKTLCPLLEVGGPGHQPPGRAWPSPSQASANWSSEGACPLGPPPHPGASAESSDWRTALCASICARLSFSLKASVTKHFRF